MSTINTNLNANEQAVLDDLFTDEQTAVTKTQVGGYVASLQDKGWIECYTDDPDFEYGFEFTPAACEFYNIVRG